MAHHFIDIQLLQATSSGDVTQMRYLVEEAKANVDAQSARGRTALMAAADRGDIDAVRYLVEEARADVNLRAVGGATALDAAVSRGRLDIVRVLVEQGKCDPRVESTLGLQWWYPAPTTNRSEHKRRVVEVHRYLHRYRLSRGLHTFVMGDCKHRPELVLFAHRLYDPHIIGVVWSFLALEMDMAKLFRNYYFPVYSPDF